jgi:hypothetical protein
MSTIHTVTVTPVDPRHFDLKPDGPFQKFVNFFSGARPDDVICERLCSPQGARSKGCFQKFADALSSVRSKASKFKDAIVNMLKPAAAPKKQESEADVRKRCSALTERLYAAGAGDRAREINIFCPATGLVGLKNLELNLKHAVLKAEAEPGANMAKLSDLIRENAKSPECAAMLTSQWVQYEMFVDSELASDPSRYSLSQMLSEFKEDPDGVSKTNSSPQLNKRNLAARLNELAQLGLPTTAHMLKVSLLQSARDCGLQPAFRDEIAAVAEPVARFFMRHGVESMERNSALYNEALELIKSVVDVLDRIKKEAAGL